MLEEARMIRRIGLLLCRAGWHDWKVADWIYVQGRKAIAVHVCRRCHAVRRMWMPQGAK